MKKIATLGPAGTFTEIAAKKYQQLINEELEIKLYPTIPKSCEAIGKECEWGIIPIENTLDGYVQRSLDILLGIEFKIVHELFLPIQFSFVSNEKNLNNLQRIYAQFKSQGQCMKFLDQFESRKIITTASNGISFERMNNLIPGEAAIIASHLLTKSNNFAYVIDNVTDYDKNETRFIIFSSNEIKFCSNQEYKTSLIVLDVADEPGALSKILNAFADNSINIHSIMSRPTKKVLGKYHFFIDIEGHYPEEKGLKDVIYLISQKNEIKIAGSYYTLR